MSESDYNSKLMLQKSLLKLSTKSEQILAKNSGHFIQFDEPELVIQAIRKLVDQNKGKQ